MGGHDGHGGRLRPGAGSRAGGPPLGVDEDVSDSDERIRLDKWLWAARFFKTRSLATEAVDGGKVQVNGERVKPARAVRVGDQMSVRIGPYVWGIVVRGLSDRRGPAPEAQKLYEEASASLSERLATADRIRAARPMNPLQKGRPTKKDRRELDRLHDPDD